MVEDQHRLSEGSESQQQFGIKCVSRVNNLPILCYYLAESFVAQRDRLG